MWATQKKNNFLLYFNFTIFLILEIRNIQLLLVWKYILMPNFKYVLSYRHDTKTAITLRQDFELKKKNASMEIILKL